MAAADCRLCATLGPRCSWGNDCPSPHAPDGFARLQVEGDSLRVCPDCGTRYRWSEEWEHAADHYMPDHREHLERL